MSISFAKFIRTFFAQFLLVNFLFGQEYAGDTVILKGFFIERYFNAGDEDNSYDDLYRGIGDYVFIPMDSTQKLSAEDIHYYFNKSKDSIFFCDDIGQTDLWNDLILKNQYQVDVECKCPYFTIDTTIKKRTVCYKKYRYNVYYLRSTWLHVKALTQDARLLVGSQQIKNYKEVHLFIYLDKAIN